jgi:NAD(P)-dependent dehydrogenase (short-subunit alcohol dehydrogenase family)
MKKQTIIVTGAASGIGKGIAKYFLDRGDNVVINSFTPTSLEKAYNEFGAGDNLAMLAGDVSDKRTGEQLVALAVERFGTVDVLVNNAGIFDSKPFLEVDEAYLDKFLTTNLKGVFFYYSSCNPSNVEAKRWCCN